ncbi:protein ClpB [Seminavis robusta]|uniref:Protein ClpB n=1 Tax=Seminavis robusta TaxID=568900 RepID=A0A9N8E6J9_9STRA|nr:protein ClpB [Seminavis robusta]|eukprot:Sro727_g193640.1 protein ClpB (858) ;mRNA; f:36039-38983
MMRQSSRRLTTLARNAAAASSRSLNSTSSRLAAAARGVFPKAMAVPCLETPYYWRDSHHHSSPSMSYRHFSSQPLGNVMGGGQQQPPQKSALEQYTVDLTAQAENHKLDPIIGRHEEIRRCLQILARRTKNNPILIGEAGVGKTAIAEGLAQRIVSGEVPESMKDKRVLRLDVTGLVSGAMFQGQFEQRLQDVIKEVQAQAGKIILFIDEIHTMVGAGRTGQGGNDMSNMLKPALARGELQMLGATTLDEYRIMEKDAALARRFQSVYCKEPDVEDTLSILRGLKNQYELHHAGIRLLDEALVAAATLSDRYITDRKQPDKSIDLVDEACSRLRLEQESKPEIIWKVERDLLTRQIELSALENEDDPKSLARKQSVQEQVDRLKAEMERLTNIWQQEKNELNKIRDLKEELEQARAEADRARKRGDYTKAGEMLHGAIPKLEDQLAELELAEAEGGNNKKKKNKMLEEAVTADAIATIIARHTGIPVSRITGSESQKLLTMEDKLRERVVGQDHALEAVSNCVRLARTRLQANDRTLGNFLFLGPTGVGKTELCKALAEFIFDDPNAMTRIDMSEYGEKHTVSRLIGAPPGYVGYDEGGVLTESIRRRPYQVILLDEFEKGHRDVWNLLLQLFDEGHLTDSHGRQVDFRNCIIVMTSNLGAHVLADLPSHFKGTEPEVEESIMDVVRHTLSPELLNRIDETVIFNRLQRENMDRIAEIGVQDIARRLEDGQNMILDVSGPARDCIAEKGFDIRYGARPLKRALAKELLNPLSRLVLEGSVMDGDRVLVRTRGEAEKDKDDFPHGWISSSPASTDKNDVVIIRNHEIKPPNEESWDDEEILLDDESQFGLEDGPQDKR